MRLERIIIPNVFSQHYIASATCQVSTSRVWRAISQQHILPSFGTYSPYNPDFIDDYFFVSRFSQQRSSTLQPSWVHIRLWLKLNLVGAVFTVISRLTLERNSVWHVALRLESLNFPYFLWRVIKLITGDTVKLASVWCVSDVLYREIFLYVVSLEIGMVRGISCEGDVGFGASVLA